MRLTSHRETCLASGPQFWLLDLLCIAIVEAGAAHHPVISSASHLSAEGWHGEVRFQEMSVKWLRLFPFIVVCHLSLLCKIRRGQAAQDELFYLRCSVIFNMKYHVI